MREKAITRLKKSLCKICSEMGRTIPPPPPPIISCMAMMKQLIEDKKNKEKERKTISRGFINSKLWKIMIFAIYIHRAGNSGKHFQIREMNMN